LVYDPSKNSAWAYWVENTNEANMSPPISYEELVQKTGIDFHLPLKSQTSSTKPVAENIKPKATPIGAWYPIFFDAESPQKMGELIKQIKEGRVASIQIQYDRNRELAQTLVTQIQSQTQMQAELLQSSPPESPGAQYERTRVTAIVRSK
jgi:endonuclease G